MDHNFNLNQSLNNSGSFNAMPTQQTHTGTSVWTGNFPNLQHLAQLNSQMGNVNIADSGTTYLDSYMAGQRSGLDGTQNGMTGPYYVASVQSTIPPVSPIQNTTTPFPGNIDGHNSAMINRTILPPGFLNITFASSGGVPMKYNSMGQITPLSPEEFSLFLELQKNMAPGQTLPGNNFNTTSQDFQRIPQGMEAVPVSLPGPNVNTKLAPLSPASNSTNSDLPSPDAPMTPNNNLKNDSGGKNYQHKPVSETSSNASSASIPGSPTSLGGISSFSLPDSTLSPSKESPDSPRRDGEIRTGNVPIRSQSLKYTVRYPQDKCFKCLKKVYPMEKIGPVKEAVYHKGCFMCNVCGTRLNMKNYFLNKDDNFDGHIYCKAHQPAPKCKGADSKSVLIQGAMSVPKLNKINEQIRGDNNYHLDKDAVEIRHAINVPAQDLQASNKLREKAWKKEQRKSESVPPEDVVRYQDPVPEYDADSYERNKVENNPDYETR